DRLLRDYPDAKMREPVTFLLASFYERVGDLERALKTYQYYQERFVHGPKIQDADFNVALYLDALGQTKAAITAYEKYRKEYPKSKDAAGAYLKIGALLERNGDWKKAADHFSGFEKAYRDAPIGLVFEAMAKEAKAHRLLKNERALTDDLK